MRRGLAFSHLLAVIVTISAMFLLFKFAVDSCLPSRGSSVFGQTQLVPGAVCRCLQQADSKARRNLNYFYYARGIAPDILTEFSHPTVLFAESPKNGRALLLIVAIVFLLSLIIVILWAVVCDLIAVTSEPRADPPETNLDRIRRSSYAVKEIIQGPDMTDPY